MRLFIAAMLLVQAAPAQSEAEKVEAALKTFGDRTYRIHANGKPVGTMTLKLKVENDGDRKVAIFEDTATLEVGPATVSIGKVETAHLEGLKLIQVTQETKGIEASASIRDGDAYLTVNDRHLIIRDIRDVLGEQAVIRLVGMKERKVGTAFTARVFVLQSPSDKLKHDFRCVAQETIEIGGKKVEAFKWEQKWKGKAIRDGESVDAAVENSYWIDADGTLLRFKIGPNEMTLESK